MACGGVHKDEDSRQSVRGTEADKSAIIFSEGANFRREQNFGGRILSWDKHNCSHVGGANVYLVVHTQKAWFGRECWREFSVMANLALVRGW